MTDTQAIDAKSFRKALSQFPTGVTVITVRKDDGEPIGVTASSFNSVSMDPPLILWSVDKNAYSAEIFKGASHFCVNVLAQDQMDISNRFAGRGEDKFGGIETDDGLGAAPMLRGCAAQFQCANWNCYDGGDHYILVGEVKILSVDDTASPLVFACGSYAISEPHPGTKSIAQGEEKEEGFIDSYLLYALRTISHRFSASLYPKLMEVGDIHPEEWRILTMLAETGKMEVEQLSVAVMQPEAALRDTLETLILRGLVRQDVNNAIVVTDAGKDITKKLVGIAIDHEADLLGNLPASEAELLKKTLHTVMERLPSI